MRRIILQIIFLIIIGVAMVSCGPSQEEIAQMTAAAWTDTPVPTAASTATPTATPTITPSPTPTPLPYDLEVNLQNENGGVISYDAYISIPEYDPIKVDESGKATLINLPAPDVEISAFAQGYQPLSETVALEHGPNTTTLTLVANPKQVNPATACQEGQRILYLEDFEDEQAQGWNDLVRPAWSIGESEEYGKNITAYVPSEVAGSNYPAEFGNAIWHFYIQYGSNPIDLHINWHTGETDEGGIRYFLVYNPLQYAQLHFQRPGEGGQLVERGGVIGEAGVWEKISFAYFKGALDVYVNDTLIVGADHDNPIESGGMGFIITDNNEPISFDNMVVCELTGPYEPPLPEEAVE